MRLVFVHPNDLREHWDTVKQGLQKIREHSAEGWLDEDVYHALKSGVSTLHLVVYSEYVGFVILTPTQHYDGKALHIWCLHLHTEEPAMSDFLPEIERMAREIGAKRITFTSPRKGWQKLEFFEEMHTIYERRL